MGITSRFSISRDTLIRHIFEDTFFKHVPQLIDLEPQFKTCQETYKQELEKKGCTCRMTTEWAKDCLNPLLERLVAAKKTDHDLVRNFIRHVGRYSDGADVDYVAVGVLYDKFHDIFVDTTDAEKNNANVQSN